MTPLDSFSDPTAVAATYFRAWKDRDFDTLRLIMADDVTFQGPLAQLDNADDCIKGLRGMSEIMTDIVVVKRFVDGPDVLTWFDLHTSVAIPCPTANWSHVEDGKIAAIRVVFDPRPLTGTTAGRTPPGKESRRKAVRARPGGVRR